MKPVDNLTLEEIDQKITKTAVEAAIEIGYYLKQIRDRKLYEQVGCRDVFEYAQKQYGYDKSVASRHMSRNDRFSIGGDSPWLDPRYLDYGKNQLQEMVSMTDEQLEQVTPAMTVREMRELKKKPEKAEEPGQKERKPEQKKRNPGPGAGKPEPVATSQQDEKNSCPPDIPGCRRQEWGLSAAQQKLSAYGLPVLEYPPDSLIADSGCGEYGGILHHCFSCHMNGCQLRKKDCYCVDAPMGNPFPCRTLLLMEQEQVRGEIGDHPCQFLDHGLADHRAGDGAAVPCCQKCDNPCIYQCDRAAAVREEKNIIDGECREVEIPPEDGRYEEASDLTDMELAQKELETAENTLKLMMEAFTEKDLRVRKQKLIIGALAAFICDLDSQEMPAGEQVQPELPVLRNNDQRKEWLRKYKDWGLWYEDENIGAKYYKYDFANGARLIVEVYQELETKHVPAYESSHLHLVGGPEPPRKGFLDKWTRHERYSRYPNSETELVEFLKEVQRNG